MCLVNVVKTLESLSETAVKATVQRPIMKGADAAPCETCRPADQTQSAEAPPRPIEKVQTLTALEDAAATRPDFLAVGTHWTRVGVIAIGRLMARLQRSTGYRILTQTAQPAHVVAILVTVLLMAVVYPINSKPDGDESTASDGTSPHHDDAVPVVTSSGAAPSKWIMFSYLSTFAIHTGAQMWMTFVSGLALYFSLPRHTFASCQKVLFPKFFAIAAVLSMITLACFCNIVQGTAVSASGTSGRTAVDRDSAIQIGVLSVTVLVEMVIRLYLSTPLLDLMKLKYRYEMLVGSGQEIGYENQKQLKASAEYQRVHKAFRRIHMTIAMGNMLTVACSFSHIYYLVQRITFN